MPPPTQRWIAPSAIANVRIVSARSRSPFAVDRVRARPWTRLGRPARAGDEVDRRDLRRARHGAAREGRREELREPDAVAQRPLDRARPCARRRPARAVCHRAPASAPSPASHTRERSFRSRSTIITCSAASFSEARSSRGFAERPRPLDRHRPDALAAPREGRARATRRRSPSRRRRTATAASGRSGASALRELAQGRPRTGASRCWTRLTWYTSPRAIALARRRPRRRTRPRSTSAPTRRCGRPLVTLCHLAPCEPARGERELRARLEWRGLRSTPNRLREPVAEEEVRDERLPAGREEASRREPLLDPREGPRGSRISSSSATCGLDELAIRGSGEVVVPEDGAAGDEQVGARVTGRPDRLAVDPAVDLNPHARRQRRRATPSIRRAHPA